MDISIMVLSGANPATYEPKPKQMVGLTKSKIYFAIDVPFEKVWLKRFIKINSHMKIIHTEMGIEKIMMDAHHHEEEKNLQPNNKKHHGIRDPHIWLSPTLVKIQARNIFQGLSAADPRHREQYQHNYNGFIRKLEDLHHTLENNFKRGKKKEFLVFHPSWGYFAKTYGLLQTPVEIEGKEPTPKELREVLIHARIKGIKTIFAQPQFSTKSAKAIAKAIGGQVILIDPLGPNWLENLLDVAGKIQTALK